MTDESKQFFTEQVGPSQWDESWEQLAKHDAPFFNASVKLMAVPRKKQHLSPKIQSLVSLVVDCASTHLFMPGVKQHMSDALAAGASVAEVLECIELASTLGIHACNIGIPTLVEVMKEEGLYDSHPSAGKPFDDRRLALKDDFAKKRGYWHTFWDDFLALDPEFFEAYTEFSSVPWTKVVDGKASFKGALEPKVCLGGRGRVVRTVC